MGVAPIHVCTVVQENAAGIVCVCVCVCVMSQCVWVCGCVGVCVCVCVIPSYISLGILRNMSFEKTAFRKEIIAFEGVEALLKVK